MIPFFKGEIVTADKLNGNFAGKVEKVGSIAALKQLPVPGATDAQTVILDGYATANDGGQGVFIWSPTAPNADDGGTIIAPNSNPATGRWLRLEAANYMRPEWFGTGKGNLISAINALPATGGTVLLRAADYNITSYYYLTGVPGTAVGNQKKNVKLIGSGMPTKTADGTRFQTGSGTVIQGSLINFGDGFEVYNLGIDVGPYVVGTLNAGVYMEGFIPGTHQMTGTANDDTYIKNVSFGNIRVLMKPPTADASTLKHGCLIEHIDGVNHGYVEIECGFHGYVVKSKNVKGGTVWAYGQTGDAWIIKSDQYTFARDIEIEKLAMGRRGYWQSTAPGHIQSTTGYVTGHISIGTLDGFNCGTLLAPAGDNEAITDIIIGKVIGDGIAGDGITINSQFNRLKIGSHLINNPTSAGIRTTSGCVQVHIGSGSVVNAGTDGYALGGDVTHGKIEAVNCAGWGVNRSAESVVDVNGISGSGNTSGLLNSLYTVLSASGLLNGWTQTAGAWPFQVVLSGNTYSIYGAVQGGTSGIIATLPAAHRSAFTRAFITAAYNSTNKHTTAYIEVDTAGNINFVNMSELAAGTIVSFNFSYLK